MQDDDKKPEDTQPQETTAENTASADDIDDLDLDDDDFEDVAWDDFDDLDDELDEDIAGAPTSPSKPGKTIKQKSFFSRHFNTIVIGAAVVGGLGWFLVSMSKPSVQPAQPQDPAPQEEITQGMQESNELQNIAPISEEIVSTTGFMKDPDSLLKGLEKVEAQKAKQDAGKNIPPMPTPVQTQIQPDEEESPLTPFPEGFVDVTEQKPTGVTTNSVESELKTDKESVTITDISEENTEPSLKEISVSEGNDSALVDAKASIKIEALSEKMQELETFMTTSSADINAQIAVLDEKIGQLTTLIEAVAKQKQESVVAKAPVKEAPPAKPAEKKPVPVAAKKPEVPAETKTALPKAEPKPVVKTTPKKASTQKKITTNWQLRGAGANMAMIAPAGSNEIKTVRLGDTISGLGKISFIGQENGRWVVRGAQGEIRQ